MTSELYSLKLQAIKSACTDKKYQIKESEEEHGTRLDISDTRDRVIVKVYHKGTIQVQGKECSLKSAMEKLKSEIEESPAALRTAQARPAKPCVTNYDIMVENLRDKIKASFDSLEATIEIENNPSAIIQYRASLAKGDKTLKVTQYRNGTLTLQGKENNLLNDACDLIDKIASPSDKEIVARFISKDEDSLKDFTAKYTPELTVMAEKNIKNKIGSAFDFLWSYDQKYLVAAESLSLLKIALPEYSAIVMPASKAFEGFVKNLLVTVKFYPADHFNSKKTSFSYLNDSSNPTRKTFCTDKKYNEAYLVRIQSGLDFCRNFMLHSDNSHVTKVETPEEAQNKLEHITGEIKEIFDYFNREYGLATEV